MLTVDELKQVLHYDSETGVFTWVQNIKRVQIGDEAGTVNRKGYRYIKIKQRPMCAHRLAWLYVYGSLPDGQIDHVNGDKSDNRISNLRIATASNNAANSKRMCRNTSGFKGVCLDKRRGKWKADIKVRGKTIYLGRFDSAQEAHKAYVLAAKFHFGQFARFE